VAQHRAILAVLDEELQAGVHALAIEIVGPEPSPHRTGPEA
jgi:stress-induced morphogen